MEEQVLYNVLKNIKNGGNGSQQAPTQSYLDALDTVGIINIDWDTTLTKLGHSIFDHLEYKLDR